MTKKQNQQRGSGADQGRERPSDDLPNPTANASLTDPGSPPASASAGSTASTGSPSQGAGQAEAAPGGAPPSLRPPANLPELKTPPSLRPPANLPELQEEATPASGGASGAVARPMAATRQSAGAGERDESGLIPEIPWDPTGKIDDETERRTLGTPKGGGTSPQTEDVGPGRYGGESDPPVSPGRYAGAGSTAPTSPTAGASLPADNAGHQLRQSARDESGLIPEIPWDPTGKIDDETERRTLGAPKGGGQSRQAEDAGPGRYGGESDQSVSPNRYAAPATTRPPAPRRALPPPSPR